jgi:hypothetical protein
MTAGTKIYAVDCFYQWISYHIICFQNGGPAKTGTWESQVGRRVILMGMLKNNGRIVLEFAAGVTVRVDVVSRMEAIGRHFWLEIF